MNLYGGIFKFFCKTFCEAANSELSSMVGRLPGYGIMPKMEDVFTSTARVDPLNRVGRRVKISQPH